MTTQKISGEDTCRDDLILQSNIEEFIGKTSMAVDKRPTSEDNITIIPISTYQNEGVSAKPEIEKMTTSKSCVIINSSELPLAEEIQESGSRKYNYDNVNIIIYILIHINFIYNNICQHLGCFGKALTSRIVRLLFGITGVILLCYTLLYHIQSQKLLPWTIWIPWTLRD